MPTHDSTLELHARRLKALGHPSRLAIVRAVVQGAAEGVPVGEIQARLDIPPSTLSHHLSELAQAGLLKSARQGTTIRYAVRFENLKALTDYLWQDCCKGGGWDPNCNPGAGSTCPPPVPKDHP
jgi:ArsR family transcriptional regulator, arsenate/arsenite/antimonite-responsive transcriptional repressor